MELSDKVFSMEDNEQEYFDRCEDLYQQEEGLIKAIIRQCSTENLVGRFALLGNSEYNKTVYHYKLPSGLHIYANSNRISDKYYTNLTGGIFILSHEIPPETLQNPRSFLQLADGADALIQWGDAGTGSLASSDYITYRINCHSKEDTIIKNWYRCSSDITAGFTSIFTNGKNHHIVSKNESATPMNLDEKITSLSEQLHEVINMSSLSEDDKKMYYDKFLPLQQMLEIEKSRLIEQKENTDKTPLQQREDELSELEAETQMISEVEALKKEQEENQV